MPLTPFLSPAEPNVGGPQTRTRARTLTLPAAGSPTWRSGQQRAAAYRPLASTSEVSLAHLVDQELKSPTQLPRPVYRGDDRHLRQMAQEIEHLFGGSSPRPSPLPSPSLPGFDSPPRGPFVPRPLLLGSGFRLQVPPSPGTPATPATPPRSAYLPRALDHSYFDSTTSLLAPSQTAHGSGSREHLVRPTQCSERAFAPNEWRQRLKNAVRSQLDPKFVKQLVDPRELVLPLTAQKILFWAGYASIGVGLYFAERYGRVAEHIRDGLRYNNYILMGVIYGLEPALLLVLFTLAHYGPRCDTPAPQMSLRQRRERAKTDDTALVIPAHNSDPAGFRHMLETALKSFKPENIFVVDNANCAMPVGETQALVRQVDADIHYMWLPLGNKNAAQYVGSLAVRQQGLKYVLVVDDDVLVPETFIAPTHLLVGKVKAACFPIQAVDKHGKKPLFVSWQDLEYKMAGFAKLAERRACGVLYPHGACSFWERETLLSVLRKHDLIFFGEDLKLGLGLMRSGQRLTVDDSQVFNTESPETLFGPAPNFYQQRVRSWEMGRHILYKEFFQALLGRNGQDTLFGFSMQKTMQTYAIASNAVDWMRVPLFVAMGSEWHFWARVGAFSMLPIAPALLYKYIICRQRPELSPSLPTVLTFPVYKAIYSALSVIGAARSLYFYWPNKTKLLTLPEMEKQRDRRCIYLMPQFARDPGFLARTNRPETLDVEQWLRKQNIDMELAMRPLTREGREQRRSMLIDATHLEVRDAT